MKIFNLFVIACLLVACNRAKDSEVRANVFLSIPNADAVAYLKKYKINDNSKSKIEVFGFTWVIDRLDIDTRVDPADVSMELILNGLDARTYIKKKPSIFSKELSGSLGRLLETEGKVNLKKYNFP